MRTEQNDNDKAKKYFRDPAEILREKNAVLRGSEEEEGNALVEKLKAQTELNKEKNRLEVERKTFENDQVGTCSLLLLLLLLLLSLKQYTKLRSFSISEHRYVETKDYTSSSLVLFIPFLFCF